MLPSDLTNPDFYPPRDSAGSIVPHRIGLHTWLRMIPDGKLLAFFDKRVPEDFWAEEVAAEEFRVIVACPCGKEPGMGFGGMVACDCGRCYLHTGKIVRVGRASEGE